MASFQSSWTQIRVATVVLPAFALSVATAIAIGPSSAQTYPGKLIRFVVPIPPGGVPDVMARLTAPALSMRVGQPVIVENRPGGGSSIGTRAVATAAPDGYTLLFATPSFVTAPAISREAGFDPIKDFAPIGTVGSGSWVLVVGPSTPARSVKELVDHAKTHPGKLNWGFGQGTGPHLLGELFLAATGIEVIKVSYKGGPQAIPDILGGRVHMNFGTTAGLLPLIKEGKLRALAVTSEARSPDLPDVPTMIESGLTRLPRGLWGGLLAPARTPMEIVRALYSALAASLTTRELTLGLMKLGFEPMPGSPQDFALLLAAEVEAWTTAARLAGINPQ
jgi:tripartite-type tricarboxylate transporter receptor subunit TctC